MSKFTHIDDEGHPRMVDVGGKTKTDRTAEAEGWVLMSEKVRDAVAEGGNRKGDVLRIAELAGISAIKKTSDLIPLCHPLRLDHGAVICRLDPDKGVHITCKVKAGDVTGVEMEALTGVSVAALTVYDMCKAVDKGMEIQGVRLLEKSGGKSGRWTRDGLESNGDLPEITVAVLTVSDKGSRGEREDRSGPALCRVVEELGYRVQDRAIVPDEKDAIADRIVKWVDEEDVHMVLITGGTGLSSRDVTPEAVMSIADREVPGLGERMRSYSLNFTDRAVLSRGLAVTRGKSLILAMPGSVRGATQCFQAVESVIGHGLETLRGRSGDCGN